MKILPQRLTVTVIVCAIFLTSCGGSGGGSSSAGVESSSSSGPVSSASASFRLTSDNYGIEAPTYLSASGSGAGMVLRAAVASSMNDPNFKTICRIDINDTGAISAGTAYSLGAHAAGNAAFPGTVGFFNGHPSTLLETTGGTITFTSFGTKAGDAVSGLFDATIVDGADSARPGYRISAAFSFVSGAAGPLDPAPVAIPQLAVPLYETSCASCHSLGALDRAPGAGPELSLRGGKVVSGHNGITLTETEVSALKVLLNAY